MHDPYEQMAKKSANSRNPLQEIAALRIKDDDWLPTPGGRIMARLGNNRTFEHLFDVFVDHGRNSDWTWDPGIPGTWKGCLLDGRTHQSGECALFASNLGLLATLPEPWGLGMVRPPEYWSFGGKHHSGFICEHRTDNIVSPVPGNIRNSEHLQHPERLYLWENHKVLIHEDQVFDPSYGIVYAHTGSMGLYQCKGDHKRLIVPLGGHKYVVTTGRSFAIEYLWRQVPATERPDEPYQGPYTIDQVDN